MLDLPDAAAVDLAQPTGLGRAWVEVLVDCVGAQGLYTYAIPPYLEVRSGDVLTVPFGSQQVGGIAIQVLLQLPTDLDPRQVKPVEAVTTAGFFPTTYWNLLEKISIYYRTPLIQVVRSALPPGLLAKSQRRVKLVLTALPEASELAEILSGDGLKLLKLLQASKTGDYAWQFLQRQIKGLGAKGVSAAVRELSRLGLVTTVLEPPTVIRPKLQQAVILVNELGTLTDRQHELLEILKRRGGEMWAIELLQVAHASSATLKALEKKGCVTIVAQEVLRSEQHTIARGGDQAKSLTQAQHQALDKILALAETTEVLLHGVTGSGKTEVYLQAIAPLLAQGKSALVLVPEIGLTPQLTDRFRARFGDRVCVYHSALSDGERFDTWRQMLTGRPQVVIGTRSAVFAPLPNLGLIVLDEEHDSSFKQDQPAPCYHARTVAQWRSQLENCPLVLGSATPSLESWQRIRVAQWGQYLTLPDRVAGRPMPPIEVVDMRQELKNANRSMFSQKLQTAIGELKAKGQQGILFIHRRGYSTHVSCRSCGFVMECPHCDVSLAHHQPHPQAKSLLRCHYCGYTQSQPESCPSCGSSYLKHFGSGTQKVTQELQKLFPELKLLRFDSDTTRTKGSHRALLNQFAQGEADLLVGTQMLTKGIDLPQVTLVAIVSADGVLHMQDFRASERAFQTLLQVSGRAGRGDEPGRVILQTYTPDHPVVEAVVKQHYAPFVETELALREMLNYPPFGRLILLRLSSPDADAVARAAEKVAQRLDRPNAIYEILGPAPAAIARVARRYRWQIMLKFSLDADVDLDLETLRSVCGNLVSLSIDVDPITIL